VRKKKIRHNNRKKIVGKKKHRKLYTTTHHIVPQSRELRDSSSDIIHFSSKEQTVELPVVFHSAWHTIFDNLYTTSELTKFIREVVKLMTIQKVVTQVDIILLREKIKS